MFNQMARLGLAQKSHSSLYSQAYHSFRAKRPGKRGFSNGFGFKENPFIFNKINENFVVKGKEKVVGWWLMSVSASVFAIIILGGYTRLSRSGLSMVKWHPHKVGLPRN